MVAWRKDDAHEEAEAIREFRARDHERFLLDLESQAPGERYEPPQPDDIGGET